MAADLSKITDQPSAFASVMRYLGRPAYAFRDLLKGNVEGAVRQGADILGDTVDAILPGDQVSEFSRPEDYAEASDLFGGMKPGIAKTAVDILGGVATDPLTFFGAGLFTAAGKGVVGAVNAAKAAPVIGKTVTLGANKAAEGWLGVKNMAGALNVAEPFKQAMEAGTSVQQGVSAAGTAAARKALAGTLPEDQDAIGAILHGWKGEPGNYQVLTPSVPNTPAAIQTQATLSRLDKPTAKSLGDRFWDSKAVIPQQAAKPDVVAGMLGQTPIKGVSRPGIDLVTNPGEAAMFSGGMSNKVPGFTHIPADEAERALFTNRGKFDDVMERAEQNLRALGLPEEASTRIRSALPELIKNSQQAFKDRATSGVMNPQVGTDLETEAALYANRMYKDETPLSELFKGSSPSSAKARSLTTPESATDFLNKNPNLSVEMNAAKMAVAYTQQQAGLMGKAAFANKLIEPYAVAAEKKISDAGLSIEKWTMLPEKDKLTLTGLLPEEAAALTAKGQSLFSMGDTGGLTKGVNEILAAVKKSDPESAMALDAFWNGLPPRTGVWKSLAKVNSMFKPYATAGALIPRINFTVRNVLSGLPQILSNPEARSQWPKYAKEAAGIIGGAIDDGIERLSGGRVGASQFKQMDDALANGRGSLDNAVNALPDGSMKEALRHGVVTDGFAQQELLANEIARSGWGKKFADIRDWPAEIVKGSEKRMRFVLFDGLMADGMSAEKAARVVKETFYDYSISSTSNRAARDVIPFFQFTAKAVPQMVKAMKNHPFLIPATRPLFNGDPNAIVPEYLQRQMHIPLGDNAEGDPNYLTSLGLPIEVLSSLPNPSDSLANFGRQVRQSVVGGSNPALKTAYGVITGIDPYFGTNFMSYDKAPAIAQAFGADAKSEAARIYNALQGTGLIQPIASPIGVLNAAVDPSRSGIETIINSLTGAQIKSVDEQRALRGLIEQYLQSNPDVQKSQSFFQYSKDQDTQDAIKQLSQIKQAMAKERKAQLPP